MHRAGTLINMTSSAFPIHNLPTKDFPSLLQEIPQPPKQLIYRGRLPTPSLPLLAVVGARKYTSYGKQVVEELIAGLRDYKVGIVSGLALGIDSLAHQAALENNLYTLSIPGSGLEDNVLYPRSHARLAHRILESGGGLLSEFEPDFRATKWSFIQRNRLMAGISLATLVIEATERSGTLTTARMCVDYNRDLCVVPGNIFSINSAGPHLFLKLGATPITTANDLVECMDLERKTMTQPSTLTKPQNLSAAENLILTALIEPCDSDSLIRCTKLPAHEVNVLLTQMELNGLIKQEQGIYRAIL